ncbi:SGNH/GDSL hydrolase family protein [Iodobacter fluviatilis]|uniref:Esterase EstP n=1 Tax=Iodobacter fluviatilis TaxID=537 RepID=A0A377SVU7_9NEIS|nr:SGNH/GDSL hydrolase family protein [Iodobacter fluviatilis]TCU86198.1 phospholipase/lecithinase/hemolysin [Iodobacter fluviatilis]STR44609.1 Esterase EstP precursor [Iodobacter fluviatilis]
MNSSLPRASRPFAVLLLTSLLAACGGGGDASTPADTRNIKEVISFGDSLSDIGTYNPTTADADLTNDIPVGLRFTTKPATAPTGAVWTEFFAAEYGLNLTPNRLVNFSGLNPVTGAPVGTPSTMGKIYDLGGNAYAEGGSRIDTELTVNAKGQTISNGLVTVAPGMTYQSATALSIKGQIAKYKAARTSFNASQLVLIQGGPNDFFAFLAGVAAAPSSATPSAIQAAIGKNATSMVTQVKTLVAMGASKVVYANMPDLGVTPQFAPTALKDLATTLSVEYNKAVAAGLAAEVAAKQVVIVDTAGLVAKAIASPVSFGLVNTSNMACNNDTTPSLSALPPTNDPTKVSALTCTGKTLVAANADTNYLFADGVHPTIAGHTILGKTAAGTAMASGFVK